MSWVLLVVIGLVGLLTLAYLVAITLISRCVVTSEMFDRDQKAMQLCLIWLLPIIGPSLVFAVLLPDIRTRAVQVPLLEFLFISESDPKAEHADASARVDPAHLNAMSEHTDAWHSLDDINW